MIQSKRTQFRRFNITDLANMRKLESDPDIMRFTPSRIPQTPEQSEFKLKALLKKENETAPLGVWAVELKESNQFVGWFMLLKTDLIYPELGFMIVKDQWGKGLATEIAEALINFGLQDLKLPGISARTDMQNYPSIRVLEKLGFKFEGTMLAPDKISGGTTELKVFKLLA